LGVEVYGGVLLSTWMDRDLGLSGRLIVRDGQGTRSQLVRVDRPLARIPQLAIHLDREVNEKGLILNRQTHLAPLIGLEDSASLLSWLSQETGVGDPAGILGFDLMLHVLEAPSVSGLAGEFIHAPRLDNLASCHAGLEAFLAEIDQARPGTRLVSFHDHEEVGSTSSQGAAGSFLGDVLERIVASRGGGVQDWQRARSRSLLVSADMAHAVHPNYADRHEPRHLPRMGQGPVIKINANMRYATDGESTARFVRFCEDAEVPYQKFVMRSDLGCGSTIGPLISSRIGIQTVDVGNPMLSMHSCREMAGSADHELMIRALRRLFVR
ncbi:MAG: M18 family aminopeptidase, partial [Planctomycetes bacterium]|nr:M18 family aminopeptidase [Planctomycetota bacterium]